MSRAAGICVYHVSVVLLCNVSCYTHEFMMECILSLAHGILVNGRSINGGTSSLIKILPNDIADLQPKRHFPPRRSTSSGKIDLFGQDCLSFPLFVSENGM